MVLGAVLAALVAVVLFVPLPEPVALRDWAVRAGPLAPLAFLVAHAVVTITPVPRTAFTLAAGLMFGPVLGIVLCLVASTASAVAGFAVARRLSGRAVERLGAGRVARLERRLSRRGLTTVISARLVPAIPFAPLNYTFGATSVRWPAFVGGTAVGLVPGTTSMVLLGDAVTGSISPALFVIFLVSAGIGVVGMLRAGWRDPPAVTPSGPGSPGPPTDPV